jgi:hypothetical protein
MLDQPATDQLRRHLQQIPGLYLYAHLSLQPGAPSRQGRVTGATRTAPLPCRVDLLSHLAPGALASDDLVQPREWPLLSVLDGWALRVARHQRDGRPIQHVDDLTHYLLRHLRWSVLQPWAGEYTLQVADAVAPLYAVAPTTRTVHRDLAIPCQRCHRAGLQEVEGEDRIACSNPACRATWTPDEVDEYAAAMHSAIQAAA